MPSINTNHILLRNNLHFVQPLYHCHTPASMDRKKSKLMELKGNSTQTGGNNENIMQTLNCSLFINDNHTPLERTTPLRDVTNVTHTSPFKCHNI